MIWWVLLVTATLAGTWCLGYRSRWHRFTAQKVGLRRDYLVGLNYLLNEEPDKAVDIFIRMLEVDSDTVETHLAVGKLFRRRGEVDRAIRIHQNLIARPQLDKAYREHSLFELGQDYLSAGVLDRAEEIFLDLIDIREYALPALKALRDIYQREKDWKNAITITFRLEKVARENLHPIIAHYYCELAELEIAQQKLEQALAYLTQALDADRNCVRASLLQAKIYMQTRDYRAGLKSLEKIQTQNPDYLSEAVDGLASCYEGLAEEDQMVHYFMRLLEKYPRVPVVLILSERIRKQKGDRTAAKYVADYIRRYPSLHGLHLFINLYMSSVEGRARDDLVILQNLTKKLLSDKSEYRCVSCGFSCHSLHWLCPGCRQWSTIKPFYCLEA